MKKVFLFVMSMLLLSGNVMAQEQTPDEQYEGYLKLKPQFHSQRKTREFLMGGPGLMDMPPAADGPKPEADTK